ncbi:MAG TPA: protein kinase [Polyangiaceae bacterium]
MAQNCDDPFVGQTLAGKYRITSKLGEGGCGSVYAAENLLLGTEVAIKIGKGPRGDARALREARAAAKLRSPYTVRVFDVGRLPDGLLFIVMELLPGRSLRDFLKAHGPLPLEQATRWLAQACSALHEAHGEGLVHRDIKPSNLFVVEAPNVEPYLKLVDFGLAKSLEGPSAESTESGAVVGSLFYMAPEQVRGAEVSAQTDIWGMGVVFHECLSGQRPFERDSASATAVAIASDPPRALAEGAPGLPDLAYEIAGRCLRKLPAERFDSAKSLGAALGALGAVGDGTPRTTPPPAPDSVPTQTDTPAYAGLVAGDVSTAAHSKTSAPLDVHSRRAHGRAAPLIVALVLSLAGFAYWQARATAEREERASPPGPATPSPAIIPLPETPERTPALPASAALGAPSRTTSSARLPRPPLRNNSSPRESSASPPGSPASVTSSRLAADPDF